MEKEAVWRQHFTANEQPFVERCTDWIAQAKRKRVVVTPFLDPREQEIVQLLVNRELKLAFLGDGGYAEAERCRGLIHYDFLSPEQAPLAFIRLFFKGHTPRHQDVLGALLGLGIKREMVGDILLSDEYADVVLADEIASYVLLSLQKVGREKVRIQSITPQELAIQPQEYQERQIVVSSLRLDAVLADAFRCSRKVATQRIKNGDCKVNWRLITRPGHQIESGDVLSLRHSGRVKVGKHIKMTKKGRYILTAFFYN